MDFTTSRMNQRFLKYRLKSGDIFGTIIELILCYTKAPGKGRVGGLWRWDSGPAACRTRKERSWKN